MASRLFSSAAKPLKLYLDTLSQPCRALEIFMKINKIPYEPVTINLGKLEHHNEEFAKVTPFRKVPVIDDNGFRLTESIAIFRYLCRHHKVEDKWYPKDSRKQAAVDEYLEWQHIGLRLHCGLYVWTMFFTPNITGELPSPALVEEREEKMENALDELNDIWLKNKRYVAGDEISFADLVAATEVEELKLTGYDPKTDRPALTDWIERVKNDTNPFYDSSHTKINKIAARRATPKA
nr:glutathione S-transferase [Lygus pratensis]